MTQKTYEIAYAAIDEVAKMEEAAQALPVCTLTMPFNVVMASYCAIGLAIQCMEDRINNDLRRDRRLPGERERIELANLRAASNELLSALRAETSDTSTPQRSETP
jgi:hypothetical protein